MISYNRLKVLRRFTMSDDAYDVVQIRDAVDRLDGEMVKDGFVTLNGSGIEGEGEDINADDKTISDDSASPLKFTLGSVLNSIRPDRVLSPAPVDPPRELFKNQCVCCG